MISNFVLKPLQGGVALLEIAVMVTPGTDATAVLKLLEVGCTVRPVLVSAIVDRDPDRHDVMRIVAEGSVGHAQETLDGCACAGQHQQGEGDLRRRSERCAVLRPLTPLVVLRVFDCITWLTSGRESCKPAKARRECPLPTAIATQKSRTGRLIWMAASWGKEYSGRLATITASVL